MGFDVGTAVSPKKAKAEKWFIASATMDLVRVKSPERKIEEFDYTLFASTFAAYEEITLELGENHPSKHKTYKVASVKGLITHAIATCTSFAGEPKCMIYKKPMHAVVATGAVKEGAAVLLPESYTVLFQDGAEKPPTTGSSVEVTDINKDWRFYIMPPHKDLHAPFWHVQSGANPNMGWKTIAVNVSSKVAGLKGQACKRDTEVMIKCLVNTKAISKGDELTMPEPESERPSKRAKSA